MSVETCSITQQNSVSWKKSSYVIPLEVDATDTLLLFAGLEGRLVEVPGTFRQAAYDLLEDPNDVETMKHVTLCKLFREQGVIIPETFDELNYFRKQHEQSKYTPSQTLGLTICPTLNCNFRCVYCYQHHPPGVMTKDIQDLIVTYVENCDPKIEKLHVTWFGGEPLLGFPVIERLTERFSSLPLSYNASIITNGSKLSRKIGQKLAELQIGWGQVTLDGPREIHDARRPLAGGRPSFDKVLTNITEAIPNLSLSVRVNVDQRNIDTLPILLDQLDTAGLRGRVAVYFAPVAPYTEVCTDVVTHCVSGPSWAELQSRLQLMVLERGYGSPSLPSARCHVCLADRASDLVIVPSGKVFKCWNDVTNPSQAIFDFSTMIRTPKMEKNLSGWMCWGPFNFPDCEKCSVLPLCMGGCPHISINHARGSCKELKHNLKETVLLYYFDHKRKQAAEQFTEKIDQWASKVLPNT